MAHTWTKIGELEEFSAGGLIKADDFNEIHEEIRDSVNDFVDEVDEVVEDLEAADTALGGRLTTAEGTITSHGTRLTTAEGTLTTHGSTLTSHGSTLTNHGSRLTTAESDIDTLEASVESTQEDVEDLEDAIDTVEARVDAVEDDIETLETLIAANTTAITNEATRAGGVEAGLNTRLGTAESTITSHTNTLTGHTNTLGQHTNSINNHGNRLSVAEGNITSLNTNKQNKLTAGENITITNNIISAIDTNSVFKIDSNTPIADIEAAKAAGKIIMLLTNTNATYLLTWENSTYYYFTSFHSGGQTVRVYTAQLKKSDHTWTSSSYLLQNELTAGTGITISNNVISATGGESNLLIGKPPSEPSDPQPGELTYEEIDQAVQAGKLVMMIDPYTETDIYTYGGFWNFNHLFYYTWHDGYNTYTQRGLFNRYNEWTVGESNILKNENAVNKAYSITASEFDEDDAYPNLKAVKDYAQKKKTWELIKTVTFTGEEDYIEITTDTGGSSFVLSNVMVSVSAPPNPELSGSNFDYLTIHYVLDQTPASYRLFPVLRCIPTSSQTSNAYSKFWTGIDQAWVSFGTTRTGTGPGTTNNVVAYMTEGILGTAVNGVVKIKISKYPSGLRPPEGTQIKLYGIRA